MAKQIQINLARSAGFCFGVRRAIRIAQDLAGRHTPIYMLGDLVHNETVIQDLQQAGLRKIKRLQPATKRILLLRAHGAPRAQVRRARRSGYRLVDATCPMVKEIHRIVRRMDRRGYRIIVLGDRQHDEVRGIVGQISRRALVIEPSQEIPWQSISRLRRAALVVQSTQHLERVENMVRALQKVIPQLVFFNTICNPTRLKQAEIKTLPLQNDVMLIIGSRTSANTRRLYEISRALNPRSYWIQTAEEIDRRWLVGQRSVGITAGASTPPSTWQKVIAALRADPS